MYQGAKLGCRAAGDAAWRIDGGHMRNSSATKLMGEKFAPSKNFSPVPRTEPEAAKEFSALILPFSVGELAQASGRSKETAKCWKAGKSFPNGVSLMLLMAEFPRINGWVTSRTGVADSPRAMAEAYQFLEKIMAGETPESRAMRARLQQLMAERTNSEV